MILICVSFSSFISFFTSLFSFSPLFFTKSDFRSFSLIFHSFSVNPTSDCLLGFNSLLYSDPFSVWVLCWIHFVFLSGAPELHMVHESKYGKYVAVRIMYQIGKLLPYYFFVRIQTNKDFSKCESSLNDVFLTMAGL